MQGDKGYEPHGGRTVRASSRCLDAFHTLLDKKEIGMSSIRDNSGIRNDKKITLRPGEGKSYWLLGDLYTFKATGDDTGGAFAMVEAQVQPQNGPPPHIHRREDETFYVLEGEFSFLHGDAAFSAGPGSFIYIPKGTLHTYKNVSGAIGRLVFLFSPAHRTISLSDPLDRCRTSSTWLKLVRRRCIEM